MTINTQYVPLFTIEEVILDKSTGLPLAAGVVKFYKDSQPATQKQVYQLTGTYPNYSFISVGSQLTLGLSGTFIDSNGNPFVPYAYPYDANGDIELYYVTVESSGGVSQFVRHAVPYVNNGSSPGSNANFENELCNPQFVEVLFNGNPTISVTGTNTVTPIAPGWDIISSGTGTLTLQRLEPTASGVITNPPYTLSIAASAAFGASVTLRQRLNNTPSLMRGGFVSASMTAAVLSGGASTLSMSYAPSTGVATTLIALTAVAADGNYYTLSGTAAIPQQGNTAASTGYIDINIPIPTSRTIAVTSIQIAGVDTDQSVPFDQQTVDRQKDHLFHYYENAVVRQPKANLLTGWTFGLNPWQFRTTSASNVANNTYTADQTIIIQQAYVAAATANNVKVGRASFANNYAFQITAVTATNKVMMLQYIDPATIRPYWGETLSVRFRASISTTNGTAPTFKVRLMYKANLPGIISQTVPAASWSATNDTLPDVSGDGWAYLSATNDPTYTLTGTMQGFNFDGFVLPASTNANMTLGVAFIMLDPLVETGAADVINIERVSLVRNDFAIDASPETFGESLYRCQYFYQKSFLTGTVPVQNAGVNTSEWIAPQTSAATITNSLAVFLKFQATMCGTPAITTYNPAATNSQVRNISINADCSAFATSNITTKGFYGLVTTAGASDVGNILGVHWTASALLGVDLHS